MKNSETILPSLGTLPDAGEAAVEVNPTAVLSKEGTQAMTSVVLTTQNIIPSGTPVEARITERYNLTSGDLITPKSLVA